MSDLEEKMSEVDKQISAAKASRAKRAADPDREAKRAAAAAERIEKKAERDRAREERIAARANKPVHMAKVERAATLLPMLSERAEQLLSELTASLPRDQVSALAQHLNHFNRVQATQSAAVSKVTVGQTVRITSGDKKFIGMVGTVEKAQRIRCYINVGAEKLVYLYSSDVEVIEETAEAEAV